MMTFVNIMIVGEAFRFRMHGVLGDKLGVCASSFCISCKQGGVFGAKHLFTLALLE